MSTKKTTKNKERKWLEPEGKLVVDVIENNNHYLVLSAIAGVDAKQLDISFKNNMLSIRGNRPRPDNESSRYLLQECYWGPFSRQISLDEGVNPDKIKASVKDGILTIKVPRTPKGKKKKIEVKE